MTDDEIRTKSEDEPFDISGLATTLQNELKLGYDDIDDSNQEEISDRFMQTGIQGFDQLLANGIPKGSNILLTGTTGAGKTIFALQMLMNHAKNGERCLFISFEESEERLIQHMKEFGWDPEPVIDAGFLKIKRYLTSDIYYKEDRATANVQAMMARNSDHLLLDLEPFVIGEEGYKPDITVVDSLTAIASTFDGKERSLRFHLERLFRFFERLGGTTFLITQPSVESPREYGSGTEEYLSDGIIILYNLKHRNIRESAVEVLKMRGAKHEKKIVAMSISNTGLIVHPNQEIFADVKS